MSRKTRTVCSIAAAVMWAAAVGCTDAPDATSPDPQLPALGSSPDLYRASPVAAVIRGRAMNVVGEVDWGDGSGRTIRGWFSVSRNGPWVICGGR